LKHIAEILFDYTKKHSSEDVPEQQGIKPKKYNKGWENVRRRNREWEIKGYLRDSDISLG
jgi:hypothetical protein